MRNSASEGQQPSPRPEYGTQHRLQSHADDGTWSSVHTQTESDFFTPKVGLLYSGMWRHVVRQNFAHVSGFITVDVSGFKPRHCWSCYDVSFALYLNLLGECEAEGGGSSKHSWGEAWRFPVEENGVQFPSVFVAVVLEYRDCAAEWGLGL
jgi:hypothetical protein